MQLTVSFDLDDVLAALGDTLLDTLAETTGKRLALEEIVDFDRLHHHYGLSEFPEDIIIKHQVLERCEVTPNAREMIELCRDQGHRVMITTARAWHPRGHDVTAEWFRRQKLHYDRLEIVHHGHGKREVFDRMPGILFHVDDVHTYAADAASHQHVAQAFMMDRPWNRGIETPADVMLRIHCLTEMKELIQNSRIN